MLYSYGVIFTNSPQVVFFDKNQIAILTHAKQSCFDFIAAYVKHECSSSAMVYYWEPKVKIEKRFVKK